MSASRTSASRTSASAQSRAVLIVAIIVAVVAAALMSYRAGDALTDPDRIAGHLGPTPGPSSTGHVNGKRAYLERLAAQDPAEEAAALVSLTRYVRATTAQSMARAAKATAVFIKLPGSEPEVQIVRTTITGALADRTTDLRKEFELEIDALTEQGSKTLVAQRRAELAKVKPDCVCVYAFALEKADVGSLRDLAKRREVRLVDVPDPVVDDLAGWRLVPIVPKVPAG